jgi:glycosyltransferase 2 family protein
VVRRSVARRWLWIVIALVIAFAVFSMAGDLRGLGDSLSGFAWSALIAALALAFANYALRFVRWQLYLRHQYVSVPIGSSAIVFGAGLSLSITPGKLGELVKSYLLRELHDIPAPKTAPIVVAERVSDLVALLLLAVIGVAAYGVDPTLVIAAGAIIALGLVLLAWPRPTHALVELVTLPAKLAKLRAPLHETLSGLAALCRPGRLVVATLIAVPAWGCECIGFALIVDAFPGAHVDLGLATVIYAGTTIAGALSFLPGGLGVTEGAMTLALVQGAGKLAMGTALAATLLTRLATLWFAVLIGVVLLAVARRRIARRSRPAADKVPAITQA